MPTAYVTAPSTEADAIAETLVEERLAACVNAVPCRSWYRWDDAVQEAREVVLICKTTTARYSAFESRVHELHPYDVPAIERFDESDVPTAYAEWVTESTSPRDAKDNS